MKPIIQAASQVNAESGAIYEAVSRAIRPTLSEAVGKAASATVFIDVYDVVDNGNLSTISRADHQAVERVATLQ
jgi:hypothetical protein